MVNVIFNHADIILIAILSIVVILAIKKIIKTKKNGGCISGCGGNCDCCSMKVKVK